jgi:type I restriction enzyme S subunit
MMLRPDKDKILPKFFLYQLLSPFLQEEQIQPRCTGSASPHLNIGDLKKFPFLLPLLHEQRQIVSYLDSIQSKVNQAKKLRGDALKEFDALLPAILDKAFKGEL